MGGKPVLFPVLEITDVTDKQSLLTLIEHLEQFDLAIFVSPNAVNKAMPLIIAKRSLPANLKIAVVGKGSADALQDFGVKDVIMPTGRYDSEALLTQSELQQMQGKRVVIFRGNDGRKLLGDSLIERGAVLEYAQCYHRGKPDIDAPEILATWSHSQLKAVTMTSSEGLLNLFSMVGTSGQQLLKDNLLFTAHERIANLARELGIVNVITTKAGDAGLLQGLIDHFQTVKNHRDSS